MQFGFNGILQTIPVVATYENGIYTGPIPDVLLMKDNAIVCYLYFEEADFGITGHEIHINVKSRPRPSDVEYTPEEIETFDELVSLANSLIGQAQQVTNTIPSLMEYVDQKIEGAEILAGGSESSDPNRVIANANNGTNGSGEKRGYVTFVTDDGRIEDITVFKPIFDRYGVGCTTAIPTNRVGQTINGQQFDSLEQLRELQNSGWEICSHAHHSRLTELSDVDLENELLSSRNWLLENGFNGYDVLMYPYGFGYDDDRVKQVTSKYYRFARSTQHGITKTAANPLNTYAAKGLYFNTSTAEDGMTGFARNTREHWEKIIDLTIEGGWWTIIWTHSWEVASAAWNKDWDCLGLFEHVVSYAAQKAGEGTLKVSSVKEALDVFGNTVDNSCWTDEYSDHFIVDGHGVAHSNIGRSIILAPNSVKFSTPPLSYKRGYSTICVITNKGDVLNAPGRVAGVLTTHCMAPNANADNSAFVYQEYRQYGTNRVLTRCGNYSDGWGSEWRYITEVRAS